MKEEKYNLDEMIEKVVKEMQKYNIQDIEERVKAENDELTELQKQVKEMLE